MRLYDAFGATPDELNRARIAVENVLDAADVNVRWRRCRTQSADPCRDTLAGNELVIRLMRSPIINYNLSPLALGYSSLQTVQRRGTLATVYPDRVRSLAQRAHWNAGDLLGNAIAHEVGHLLLGTSTHAGEGLMRPHWTASRTRDSVPADWYFQPEEGNQIRHAVSVRTTVPDSPATPPRPAGAVSPVSPVSPVSYDTPTVSLDHRPPARSSDN